MNRPRVAILMAVHDAESWLPRVLASVAAQTRPPDEVLVMDNASADATRELLASYPFVTVVPSEENVGFWAAFERLLPRTAADVVIALTDVVLEEHFIVRALEALTADPSIGCVQAKVLQSDSARGSPRRTGRIDTLGFRVERSRRVTNIGQGEEDRGQYDIPTDILGVEGAVPVFRRSALDACRVDGLLIDPDYRVGPLGYGDDLDLAWRMTLFGWRQITAPGAIGWHGRSTTTGTAHGIADTIRRRRLRSRIPVSKRRLDWSNVRFTIIKNDRMIDILRSFPQILARELLVQAYLLLFEPRVLAEWGRFLRLLPRMVRRRRSIQSRAVRPSRMHSFFR